MYRPLRLKLVVDSEADRDRILVALREHPEGASSPAATTNSHARVTAARLRAAGLLTNRSFVRAS